jgi:hypothetical protein
MLPVKFGVDESLLLNTWSTKLCYDMFCSVLRSAMNVHLQKNILLRDVFDLGAPHETTGSGANSNVLKAEKVGARTFAIRIQKHFLASYFCIA